MSLISLFSPSDENVAGMSDGENIPYFEFLDIEMHWHCEDNGHICSSYLSESLCDEMFRSCEDNTYIIVIVIYRSYI